MAHFHKLEAGRFGPTKGEPMKTREQKRLEAQERQAYSDSLTPTPKCTNPRCIDAACFVHYPKKQA